MTTVLTQSSDFAKVATTNLITTDFTGVPLIPTTTAPTASATKAVIDWAQAGATPNTLLLIPYGTAADGDVFALRVTGWRKISTLWVPMRLLEATITLSTSVGIAGAAVVNTEHFADTIVAVGTPPASTEIYSPADNSPGWILLDALGSTKIEITADLVGGTTGANALYATL